jgi:hypothetical protein
VHCNYNGACKSISGIQKCYCNPGFIGSTCDFKGSELQMLSSFCKQIIGNVYSTMALKAKKEDLSSFDIEIISNVVRGWLRSPDLVDDDSFSKVLDLLQLASNQSVYTYQPLNTNNTLIVLDAFNYAFMKLSQSYNVRKAMKDTLLLGSSLGLL